MNIAARRRAIYRLDGLIREVVRTLYRGRCVYCSGLGCDPHHLWFKRGNLRYRHSIPNVVWVCRRCHDWAEQNATEAKRIVAEKFPAVREWVETARLDDSPRPIHLDELLEREKALKAKLEEVKRWA